MNLNQLKQKAAIVSDKVFGPQNPKTAPVRKMVEETEELLESLMLNEDPSEEFADVFLLLVDAYRKHFGDDVDMQQLIDDSSRKLDIVAKRVWGEPNEHGVFQHIEDPPDEELPWEKDDATIDDIKLLDEVVKGGHLKLYDEDTEYPTGTVNEPVNDLETAKKIAEERISFDTALIQKVYDEISLDFLYLPTDKDTRDKIRQTMEEKLPDYVIKCDEENNPPEIVDAGQVWARVTDPSTKMYVDVIF